MLMKTQGLSGFNGSLPVLDILSSFYISRAGQTGKQASNDSIERKKKIKNPKK